MNDEGAEPVEDEATEAVGVDTTAAKTVRLSEADRDDIIDGVLAGLPLYYTSEDASAPTKAASPAGRLFSADDILADRPLHGSLYQSTEAGRSHVVTIDEYSPRRLSDLLKGSRKVLRGTDLVLETVLL